MGMVPKVRFQGYEFLIVDNMIGTAEQFRMCKKCYAVIVEEGEIKRNGEIIGSVADLEVIGEEPEPEYDLSRFPEIFSNLCDDRQWDDPEGGIPED